MTAEELKILSELSESIENLESDVTAKLIAAETAIDEALKCQVKLNTAAMRLKIVVKHLIEKNWTKNEQ